MRGSTDLKRDTETGTKESKGRGKGGDWAVAQFGNLLPLISGPGLGPERAIALFPKSTLTYLDGDESKGWPSFLLSSLEGPCLIDNLIEGRGTGGLWGRGARIFRDPTVTTRCF